MAKTYNGRFHAPEKPKSATGWLIGGIAGVLLADVLHVLGVAISIGCFVIYGKRKKEIKLYDCFHQFCALIGRRKEITLKELSKSCKLRMDETRSMAQQMVARGYFGSEAYLDSARDRLVLSETEGEENETSYSAQGSWKDVVFDLLNTLRGEEIIQNVVQNVSKAMETPRPAEAQKAADAPAPSDQTPKAQEKDAKKTYMDELERTLNELYQLNQQIEDEAVSRRIDRIGELTGGIFRAVIEKPEREADVRKFMNYYLPTTIKLLRSYDMLEEQSYQGENIVASRKKIESVLDMLIEAFEKQLDRLFTNDALDIATDVDVLETMMAGDGLSSKGQMRMM